MIEEYLLIAQQFFAGYWLELTLWGTAIGLIPFIVRHRQTRERKLLAETLLRTWIGYCVNSIVRLKPEKIGQIKVKEYWPKTKVSPSGPTDMVTLRRQIQVGRIDPNGFNFALYEALKGLIVEGAYDEEYSPYKPEVVKANVRAILNQLYVNTEILEEASIPTMTLELALSQVEEVTKAGTCTLVQFQSFTMNMGHTMEIFARQLWRLKGWPLSKSYKQVLSAY